MNRSPPSDWPALEAIRLTKYYGAQAAIKDVSFSIPRGEVVGFLGPNGAGKSTTLRIFCGLLPATSGQAWVAGRPVAGDALAVKRTIGYMPENNPLPEELRVHEYLTFRAALKGVPWRQRRSAVGEIMEWCDLHRKASRRLIGTLSKGFRQRVGIADALLGKPAVAILDEPTIGLDPHQVLLTRRLIEKLRGQMTVLISSHLLAEVEVSCDRVIILHQGRVVATGTRAELARQFEDKCRYEAEVAGPLDGLAECLAALGPGLNLISTDRPQPDGFVRMSVEGPPDQNCAELLLTALANRPGLRLKSFARIEPSLESVFLAATKRSWETETRQADGTGWERPPEPSKGTGAAPADRPAAPPSTPLPFS